jgi:hypothetical protein
MKGIWKILILASFLTAQTTSVAEYDWLADRLNSFAQDYNDFVQKLQQRNIFDYKQAKRLSKKWREVEKSGFWPAPESCK